MKEATGEFSMTVVTLIAVILIAGVITWLGPKVTDYIETTWEKITGAEGAVNEGLGNLENNGNLDNNGND